MAYTVRRIGPGDLDNDILDYIKTALTKTAKMYDLPHNIENMAIGQLALRHLVLVAYRDDVIAGFTIGIISVSVFDITLKTLNQLTIYSDYPIATAKLVRYFIDFGKANANLISMNTSKFANIKGSTLEKLGFAKGDTEYRMEVQ